jgi:hypothetical protein
MIQAIILISSLLLLGSCNKEPSAKMTDEYIEIVKPGQICGLVELKQAIVDSVLGYPVQEEDGIAYSIVERNSKKVINDNAAAKIYFSKKHKRYMWKIWDGLFLSDFYYSDTISLKPDTWYRLSTERYRFKIYFYWDKSKDIYITKAKPDSGAY